MLGYENHLSKRAMRPWPDLKLLRNAETDYQRAEAEGSADAPLGAGEPLGQMQFKRLASRNPALANC